MRKGLRKSPRKKSFRKSSQKSVRRKVVRRKKVAKSKKRRTSKRSTKRKKSKMNIRKNKKIHRKKLRLKGGASEISAQKIAKIAKLASSTDPRILNIVDEAIKEGWINTPGGLDYILKLVDEELSGDQANSAIVADEKARAKGEAAVGAALAEQKPITITFSEDKSIGLDLEPVTNASAVGGVMAMKIKSVIPSSPADLKGLQSGMVLSHADDTVLTASTEEDLNTLVLNKLEKRPVTLTFAPPVPPTPSPEQREVQELEQPDEPPAREAGAPPQKGKDRDWSDLTKEQREAVELLGWVKESWMDPNYFYGGDFDSLSGIHPDDPYARPYEDLTLKERRAADLLGMTPSDFPPAANVEITSISTGPSGSTFYNIRWTDGRGGTHEVSRRYSEFFTLRKKLISKWKLKEVETFPFPEKTFGNQDQQVVDYRMKKLRNFLLELLELVVPRKGEGAGGLVYDFLHVTSKSDK